MTVYLWFSAGHLAFQSLKWVSYSTDRILRFGQSSANHDCGKYKIRFEFLTLDFSLTFKIPLKLCNAIIPPIVFW